MMSNVIDLKTHHPVFKTPGIRLSVSGRGVLPEMNIIDYINVFYMYTDPAHIDSVFGNTVRFSRLYGGRARQREHSLTPRHIGELAEHGIHLSLTLTNHFFGEAAYRESRELLKEHHKKGNSVICVDDELALRIRNDYPDYTLKASIIKNIRTTAGVEKHLDLYDQVVIPMDKNDDDEFLSGIKEKTRVVLFGNATCAYTCPARTCYRGFSQLNAGKPVTSTCSRKKIPRLDTGNVYFNIKKFKEMGFEHFKLVPLAPASSTAIAAHYSEKKTSKEPGQ
jgi:collagenase-like PrtC family protease